MTIFYEENQIRNATTKTPGHREYREKQLLFFFVTLGLGGEYFSLRLGCAEQPRINEGIPLV
jgi:DNA-binding transcriptional MerR regulator